MLLYMVPVYFISIFLPLYLNWDEGTTLEEKIISAIIGAVGAVLAAAVGAIIASRSTKKKIDNLGKDFFEKGKTELSGEHSVIQKDIESQKERLQENIQPKIEKLYDNTLRNEKDFERLCNSAGPERAEKIKESLDTIDSIHKIAMAFEERYLQTKMELEKVKEENQILQNQIRQLSPREYDAEL